MNNIKSARSRVLPTVLHDITQGLMQAFEADERVYLLGEDVLDPYGGAFKVTRGLSTKYPARVLTTPISEAGITGIAAGMALRGLRPVVEIMFGDFLTLAADQIINHIAKFRWMYNEQVTVPIVIRTPMGGRRGYGPTHSQTLEKHFIGVPGLRVVAPTALGSPGKLLRHAILESQEPVLFIENKLLYGSPLLSNDTSQEFSVATSEQPDAWGKYTPTYSLQLRAAPRPVLTLVAYGFMAELARKALQILAYQHEIFAELIVPTQLSPNDLEPILAAVNQTNHLLVIEEGTRTAGWGAEILAQVSESLETSIQSCRRVAGRNLPIPASRKLEPMVLPQIEDIVQAALTIV
jgi:pyruvate/2-oxoglutarate/acetoin dehydrogenase E1 component